MFFAGLFPAGWQELRLLPPVMRNCGCRNEPVTHGSTEVSYKVMIAERGQKSAIRGRLSAQNSADSRRKIKCFRAVVPKQKAMNEGQSEKVTREPDV